MAVSKATNKKKPIVSIIMGSDSDLPVMVAAADQLTEFGIPFELTVVSAHRTPERMVRFATTAAKRGHRRCGWCGAFARHGGLHHNPPCHWCTHQIIQFHRRLGFHPFYLADAQWHSCCHCCTQRGKECRHSCCVDPLHQQQTFGEKTACLQNKNEDRGWEKNQIIEKQRI